MIGESLDLVPREQDRRHTMVGESYEGNGRVSHLRWPIHTMCPNPNTKSYLVTLEQRRAGLLREPLAVFGDQLVVVGNGVVGKDLQYRIWSKQTDSIFHIPYIFSDVFVFPRRLTLLCTPNDLKAPSPMAFFPRPPFFFNAEGKKQLKKVAGSFPRQIARLLSPCLQGGGTVRAALPGASGGDPREC